MTENPKHGNIKSHIEALKSFILTLNNNINMIATKPSYQQKDVHLTFKNAESIGFKIIRKMMSPRSLS